MKELRFRAWNNKTKEWHGQSDPHSLTFYGFHIFGECTLLCSPRVDDLQHLEIQQFTGLYDKNGKEMYEGDVVVLRAVWGGYQEPVVFKDGCFGVRDGDGIMTFQDVRPDNLEVIGNIYETPELIDQ